MLISLDTGKPIQAARIAHPICNIKYVDEDTSICCPRDFPAGSWLVINGEKIYFMTEEEFIYKYITYPSKEETPRSTYVRININARCGQSITKNIDMTRLFETGEYNYCDDSVSINLKLDDKEYFQQVNLNQPIITKTYGRCTAVGCGKQFLTDVEIEMP